MAELGRKRQGDHVEVWTILAEGRRNTLNRALVGELIAATASLADDRTLRAVVLTGQGDKAFCAGADLRERLGMSVAEVQAWLNSLRQMTSGLEAARVPFVAAMNGSAYGGGLELAMACDVRVGTEGSELGLTEVTLAILPGAGGTQRLPRLVGLGRASELILTGRRIPAVEAQAMGLLNHLASPGDALTEALEIAKAIASNGPVAVAAAKAAIQQGASLPLDKGLSLERAQYEKTLPTKDRLEGLAAFKEKRKPVYRGE